MSDKHLCQGLFSSLRAKMDEEEPSVKVEQEEVEEEEEKMDSDVDPGDDYEEEEKFALLNSFQQIVAQEDQMESDFEPDVKTDPSFEVKVKSRPKKKKVSKKEPLDPEAEKKKKFPYECEYCPERFTSKQALQRHLNHQHPELKQDKCPFCEEMIGKYSRSWPVHLSTNHLQEKESPLYIEIMERINIKKFICTVCGRDFNTNLSLEHHMIGTHNSHANQVNCDQCGKFFKSFDTLGKHKRDIHEKSFKAHLCVDCGKILKSKGDLVDHIQRHHSDEKFPCQDCGKTFKTNKDLLKHIRRNHTKRENAEACDQCEMKFFDVEALRNHVSNVHDKIKPWHCEVCQLKCARLGNLNEHRRKTHSKENISRKILIEMVENDLHPFYTREDLPMLKQCRT